MRTYINNIRSIDGINIPTRRLIIESNDPTDGIEIMLVDKSGGVMEIEFGTNGALQERLGHTQKTYISVNGNFSDLRIIPKADVNGNCSGFEMAFSGSREFENFISLLVTLAEALTDIGEGNP